ncbi:MAG: penicillin-binding transpeptidase domain-containing protein, partial [Methylococcales bacterium]
MLVFQSQYKTGKSKPSGDFSGRRKFVIGFMMTCMVMLVCRAVYLQVFNKAFLKEQGEMRYVDEVSISAYRGMITDRNGEPLAISSPVQTIWINPKDLKAPTEAEIKAAAKELAKKQGEKASDQQKQALTAALYEEKRRKVAQMEKILQLSPGKVTDLLPADTTRQFAYVARRISPDLADQVKALKLVGVNIEREFKRYYPAGEVSAHLVGFTDVDDVGQEGIEKGYEKLLKGIPGSKRVIRDGQRQIIADIENIKEPVSGKNLQLSIDQRIQYLAYKELQQAMQENKAKSAALVVLDAQNGEILAAVNQPSFNPNIRNELKEALYRNRAMTDTFEPGSTVKPFTVAAALDGKFVRPDALFATNGTLQVGNHVVRDVHNYGLLDLTGVLKKSSNVAVSQMALKMPAKYFWGVYRRLGFGSAADA